MVSNLVLFGKIELDPPNFLPNCQIYCIPVLAGEQPILLGEIPLTDFDHLIIYGDLMVI